MNTFQEIRKTGIGGSDIAAIMGLSPYKTALDVYLEKTSEICTQDDNAPQFSRGRKLEKYILEEYSDITGHKLITDIQTVHSKEHPFLIGHVDAKVNDKNIIVEAKSIGGSPTEWRDAIPVYYKTQVAHYAAITDCDYVDIAALFDHWKFCHFTYYRDKEFEKQIQDVAVKFWCDHIMKKVPPIPVNTDDARKLYNAPSKNLLMADASPRMVEVINMIKETQENIKSLKDQEDTLKMEVMNFLQNRHILKRDDKKLVSWCPVETKRFDLQNFKTEYPEMYQLYQTNTTTRTLRVH